jgi:fermentation-respiration switch protein FrsA (DUF1100 family)
VRQDVAFEAEGITLRGWLYLPDRVTGPAPVVIMAHGFSALKEMGLDDYAGVFADAGLACLVYDHRNLGASDGEPRDDIDPIAQMRDYRHAITYARSRPELDPERVGLWGTSYSGGLVIIAAAVDRRVKCVVGQVPQISGYDTMVETTSAKSRALLEEMLDAERRSLADGNPPATVPVCIDDPAMPADAPGRLSYRYFHRFAESRGMDWPNRVTLRSLDRRLDYEAMPYMERVSPTPLLMIVAAEDTITPTDIALRAFERAREPKQLIMLQGHHYVPYVEEFERSSAAARAWFVRHLSVRSGSSAY